MTPTGRVAVLGAGPAGTATAAMLSKRGAECVLYGRSEDRIGPLRRRGGVDVDGDLGEGIVPLAGLTTDLREAVTDVGLVFICVPAPGQVPTFQAALPHIEQDAVVTVLSGSGGALEIAGIARRAGRFDLRFAETSTPPQSARVLSSGRLRIKTHLRTRLGVFPASDADAVIARIQSLLDVSIAKNVLDPALNNPNFLIHPAPMLLNYAEVERSSGTLSLINEGMTEGTLRVLDAVDAEKMALARALGLEPISIDDLYTDRGRGPEVYRSPGENFGEGFRDRIWPRYIDEDVPFGTVLFENLGRLLGVPTPVSQSINAVLSIAVGKDLQALGRSLESLGIAGMSGERIQDYLYSGH